MSKKLFDETYDLDGAFDLDSDGGLFDESYEPAAETPTESGGWQWSVTIYGHEDIITDGDLDAIIAAYDGTEFTSAIGGLYVYMDIETEIDPLDAFKPGGKGVLHIHNDAFGVATHRTDGGAETLLTTTADRNDIAIAVGQTSTFSAAPGTVYIGNERLDYAGKTGTTFTSMTRGVRSPFATGLGNRWPGYHRVGNIGGPYDASVTLKPVVSEVRRNWKGAQVRIRLHRRVGGVLETVAEVDAAGRYWPFVIAEIGDDPNTDCTVLHLDHLSYRLREGTLGRDLWVGTVQPGIKLPVGAVITFQEDGDTYEEADPLTVVSGAPGGTDEVQAGNYTADEFVDILNQWLQGDPNINGTYTFALANTVNAGPLVQLVWSINTASTTQVQIRFNTSLTIGPWVFLGFKGASDAHEPWLRDQGTGDQVNVLRAGNPPCETLIWPDGGAGMDLTITDQRGVFVDNYKFLPAEASGGTTALLQWGIFSFDGKFTIRASFDGTTMEDIKPLRLLGGDDPGDTFSGWRYYATPYGSPLEVRQIVVYEGAFKEIVPALFYSTGTAGVNHATHDVLGYGFGMAIPGELLGDPFINTVTNAAAADATMTIVIDRPRKIIELLNPSFVMRGLHLIFWDGHFRVVTWASPAIAQAVAAIGEADKSEPAGQAAQHKSATLLTDRWQKPIVNYEYNWSLRDKSFKTTETFYDSTAVDDLDGAGEAATISDATVTGSRHSNTSGLEDLLTAFIKRAGIWSRPIRFIERTISQEFFFSLAAGHIVDLSDAFARNPVSGLRRFDNRAALIMWFKWSPGGPVPGNPGAVRHAQGQMRTALPPIARSTVYSPCAQFRGSNYNDGTLEMTTDDHEHTEATDALVDAEHFIAGDLIRVVEIDPADPAAPLTWLRSVIGVGGNVIEHSSPALGTDAGEDAFDDTKRYRIISQTYSDAGPTQQTDCYQADESDFRIEDEANAYHYAEPPIADTSYTAYDHTDLPERHADLSFADGAPRDTGYERGLVRMLNNLEDHKTAHQTPSLQRAVITASTAGAAEFDLLIMRPIFVGPQRFTHQKARIWVAPHFRSTSGASVTVRVTLSRLPYTGGTLTDVTMPAGAVQVTFTTSSTTLATPAEQGLDLRVLDDEGEGYLLVEANDDCDFWGLAEAIEREREAP